MAQPTQPRGIRNNNPLNIRRSTQKWRHKVAIPTDQSFEQFDRIEWGIRAAFVIMRTYLGRQYRCRTVRDVIARWAPSCENNTENYIYWVCKESCIQQDEILDIKNKNQMCRLLWAMAWYENGQKLPFHHFEYAYELMKQNKT